VFIKEAEALLAPISAAEPGGKNPSTDERYQELRLEVDKENSPIGEAVGWPRVEGLGREILGKVAKDLLVAAYTAFALQKTRGIHGLAVGVIVVDGLFDRFWDTMFPPVARLKGRGTALKWLIEHATGALQSYQPQVADRAAIVALITASKQLRGRARDKLGDHVPSFKEWGDLLESIQAALPPEPKAEAPKAEEPAGQVQTDMSPQAGSAPAPQPVAPPPVAAPPPVVAAPPPQPAAPPPPPARPTARDMAAPWLAPIAGANPAGRDPTESPEYQSLLAEIDKLQSPTGGAIDWAAIVRDADVVLKTQAKDLRVVCHQALGRFKTGRIDGLALGLAIVAEVADAFWDTGFPPAARLRGRAGALRGMLDQIEPELGAWQPKPSERAALEQLKDVTARLQTVVRARYADQAPNLRLLLQSIDQLLLTIPAPEPPKPPPPPPPKVEAPPPPPPKVEAPPPVSQARVEKPAVVVEPPKATAPAPAGDVANSAAVDKFLRGTGDELVKLAHALRRARTSDALAYRLLRSGLWIYIAAPPPVRPDGNTAINGLPPPERARLDLLLNGGKWADLVESSESLLPTNRFSLDLHRYTAEGLKGLGPDHDAALRGLYAEVGALLTRLPKIFDLKDNSGVPLCSDAARSLLEREALGGGGGGGGGAAPVAAGGPTQIVVAAPAASGIDDAAIAQIKGLLRGKREEGLRLGAARVQSATGGRSRFLRRVELAEACLDGGEVGLARSLFAGLVGEIDGQHLETWEPELAARCLEGHVRAAPKGQPAEKVAVDAALARLAGLDPVRAAALVPKS
jgi:type VI secretion system ImpA/VasJ family protein